MGTLAFDGEKVRISSFWNPSPVPAAAAGRWVGGAIFKRHTDDRSLTTLVWKGDV